MSNWIYPEAVARVESACDSFLSGQLDAKGLQAALYQLEQEMEASEERWLRSLLSDAENKLEEMTYMVSSDQQKAVMQAVVQQLLNQIHNRRKTPLGQ